MLPSDPDYTPAATAPEVLNSSVYRQFLAINTDPYAAHSRDENLIRFIEECAGSEPDSGGGSAD